MFIACAVPAAIYGLIAFRLPESPHFLVLNGKEDTARKIFDALMPGDDTERHIREIRDSIKQDELCTQKGSLRARALGLAAVVWSANFAITLSFPIMAAGSLPLTYGMYALFAAASFFFVMFKVPETNGMSLEQADTLFVPKGANPAELAITPK
ncbi:hypothetical protein GCM10017710_48300 [Arthrobacter ramosus]